MRCAFLFFTIVGCTTVDVLVEAGAPTPYAGPWACPASPPQLDTPCPSPLSCEYEDPKPCGVYYQCTETEPFDYRWSQEALDCETTPICNGAMRAMEAGSACTYSVDMPCDQNNQHCDCVTCVPEGGNAFTYQWACASTTPPDCPITRPRLGTACMDEGRICDYSECGSSGLGPAMKCLGGLWVTSQTTPCLPMELVCQ